MLSPQLVTNTWLCGNILRVFVKSVVTGKKIDVSTPCRTTSTCMRALHADINFYFCGCGGWFVTDSHNRLHWKGQTAYSLKICLMVCFSRITLFVPGHYISDVYDCKTKQWTSYDDSAATKVSYLLLYPYLLSLKY